MAEVERSGVAFAEAAGGNRENALDVIGSEEGIGGGGGGPEAGGPEFADEGNLADVVDGVSVEGLDEGEVGEADAGDEAAFTEGDKGVLIGEFGEDDIVVEGVDACAGDFALGEEEAAADTEGREGGEGA